MATEIDKRVVEMRFDNKEFEANAKDSITTLQKLREALNFSKSKDSLDSLNKSIKRTNMDQLVEGVTALQKRFSTFGIVSMRAVENITDSMMGMANRGIKAIENSIVSGGVRRAMNLEKAHFQLQNIIGDEAQVQKVMDAANKSVDGTAYSFDVAAKAASQFYASGITDMKTMDSALKGLAGTTATFSADYDQMAMIWAQVSGKGRLQGDELIQLSSRGINAAVEITKYLNGINDGSIKASKSVTKAVQSVTKATDNTEADIRDMVSKGKINFEIFSEAMSYAFGDSAKKANETFDGALANIKSAFARIGAGFVSPIIAQNSEVVKLFGAIRERVNDVKSALVFDESIGNVNALSKQFTDSVLAMAKVTTGYVQNLDLTKPINSFYNLIDAVKNVAKAGYRILNPLGRAFRDVFLKDLDLEKVTKSLAIFTSKLKISGKNGQRLHYAFKGVLDIVKLLTGAFFKILKAIIPVNKPVLTLSELLLTVVGNIGRTLSKFSEWISKSKTINRSYDALAKVIKIASSGLSEMIVQIVKFIKNAYELPEVQRALEKIGDAISYLGRKGYENLGKAAKKVKEFSRSIADMIPLYLEDAMDWFSEKSLLIYENLKKLDLTKPSQMLNKFTDSMKKLLNMARSNDGIMAFVDHMNEFGRNVKSAFTFDRIYENVEKFQSVIGGFVNWFKETVMPLFEGVTVGGVVSAGAAGGMIYAIIKMSKAVESVSKSIKNIPNLLGGISTALKAYQKEVDANTIIKIAGAIGILAGALVLLSFADPKRLLIAGAVLAAVAAVFLFGASKLISALAKAQEAKSVGMKAAEALKILSKKLGSALKNFAKGFKYKMVGSAVKDIGIAISAISGSLVVLAKMYGKDSKSMDQAVKTLGIVAAVLVAVIGVMVFLQKKMGKGIQNSLLGPTLSVLSVALALSTTVKALNRLFKMELPSDYGKKLAILAGIFVGLGALSVAIGKASSFLGVGGKMSTSPLIGIAGAAYLVVLALDRLMKIEFSDGWGWKLGILAAIFGAMGALIIEMSICARLAGGSLKAGGTLLSLAIVIGTIVLALGVLMLYPLGKMVVAAIELGVLLAAVGAALWGAGKIVEPGAFKTVLAMAVLIGAITAALAILAIVPFPKLLKSAFILGALLLLTALNFSQIGKVSSEGIWKTVASMAIMVGAIALSLMVLADKPWDGLLAAGIAMSAVLLSLAGAFKIISDSGDIEVTQIVKFLALTIALIPIGIALNTLSKNPWESILAAGVSISLVLGVFGVIFKLISGVQINPTAIGAFLLASLSIVAIGAGLSLLADNPWESILAAGVSVSAVLLSMSKALAICTVIGGAAPQAIIGIGLLDLFIADLAAVLVALGKVFESDGMKKLLSGGVVVFETLGEALGGFVGAFIGKSLEGLEGIGKALTGFMESASGFFEGANGINPEAMDGIKSLAQAILTLTADDFLGRINKLIGAGDTSLVDFGKQLEAFAPYIQKFAEHVKTIDPESVEGAAAATDIMVQLAKSLPSEGGIIGWLMGDKPDLATFGSSLGGLADGLTTFAEKAHGITPDSVQKAADAASIMMELSKKTPKSGGLLQKLMGGTDMSTFGSNLKSFGSALAEFSKSAVTVNTDKISQITATMTSFISMAKDANSTSSQGIKDMGKAMGSVGNSSVSSYSKSIAKSGSAISSAITGATTSALESLSKENSKFQNQGEKSTESYNKGIENKKSKSKDSGKKVANSAVDGFKGQVSKFKTSGENAAQGYINGIRLKIPDAKKAASSLARQSQNALKTTNKEGSPSKIFIQSGIFSGMGYVIGMTKMAQKAYDSGKDLAEQSQSGAKLGLQGISKVFDSLDTDPVITPRVDLTGVQQSADNMNRMFNRAIHTTVDAAGSISVMQRRNETSEILSALKGLELQASGAGGDSYYINGLNYSEDQNVGNAIKSLVGAVVVQGRV